MFTFKGKEYAAIIWDWLYTLYNPDTCLLYGWVRQFFDNCPTDTIHYLVTYAKHPDLREKKIKGSSIYVHIKRLMIDTQDKSEAFRMLLAAESFYPKRVLVIGDNVDHEGAAAKNFGFDFVPVWDFAKEMGFTHE